MADKTSANAYWAANVRIIVISLVIWFACSFGLGILLAACTFRESASAAPIIGFWFAQNGSIYVFLILIFVYAKIMNKVDRDHGVEE